MATDDTLVAPLLVETDTLDGIIQEPVDMDADDEVLQIGRALLDQTAKKHGSMVIYSTLQMGVNHFEPYFTHFRKYLVVVSSSLGSKMFLHVSAA